MSCDKFDIHALVEGSNPSEKLAFKVHKALFSVYSCKSSESNGARNSACRNILFVSNS